MIARHPDVPDVVLYVAPTDTTHVRLAEPSVAAAMGNPALPLPLVFGFAAGAPTLEIGIPDYTFWGSPGDSLEPMDRYATRARESVAFADKKRAVVWRGRADRHTGARSALLECAKTIPNLDARDTGTEPEAALPAMEFCGYRGIIVAQGEGFTSQKSRLLHCNSVLIYINSTTDDVYYGRELVNGTHYLHWDPWPAAGSCERLAWLVGLIVSDTEGQARHIADTSAEFARAHLTAQAATEYLYEVTTQLARLQRYSVAKEFERTTKANRWAAPGSTSQLYGIQEPADLVEMYRTFDAPAADVVAAGLECLSRRGGGGPCFNGTTMDARPAQSRIWGGGHGGPK